MSKRQDNRMHAVCVLGLYANIKSSVKVTNWRFILSRKRHQSTVRLPPIQNSAANVQSIIHKNTTWLKLCYEYYEPNTFTRCGMQATPFKAVAFSLASTFETSSMVLNSIWQCWAYQLEFVLWTLTLNATVKVRPFILPPFDFQPNHLFPLQKWKCRPFYWIE